MSWYEANPTLLKEELVALSDSGYQYKIDEEARKNGCLTIYVTYIIDDKEHTLKCDYPASYPFFAVRISAPTFPPGRHKDPYFHGICLFEDEQSVWNIKTDTLAKALNEQIPEIIKAHAQPEVEYENEGHVGYQVTGQIKYENPSVFFVDDFIPPESVNFGDMTLRIHKDCTAETPLFGFIENITSRGNNIKKYEVPLIDIYSKHFTATWVKLDAAPNSISGIDILNEAIQCYPKIKTPNFKKKNIDIVGLYFPEEAGYRESVYNWIFVVRRKQKKHHKNKNISHSISIIRSDRYTSDNINKRTPRLKSLANKTITIVGAGALGSEVTLQLAKAGIGCINIIDYDVVQVGNSPRWVLGLSAVGKNKVDALYMHILQNYPSVKCFPINLRIGVHQQIKVDNTWTDEREFIEQLINKSDMIIDTAAETNISAYLSQLCLDNKTDYVWATGTQGAWGGIIGRIATDTTNGTWMDFSNKNFTGEIHAPPAEEGSDIQPVGCFHQTFTGTGFDMDHISIMATKLAVSTMLRNEKEGYPDLGWDVGVLELWDENTALPIFPKWHTYTLDKSPK